MLLPLDCGHKAPTAPAAVGVAATSPKKYATNCLNSPTQISYSVYLVCRRCRRLALNAFMSRNFSHVLKLKTFLLPFSWSLWSLRVFLSFIYGLANTHTHSHTLTHVLVRRLSSNTFVLPTTLFCG